MRGLAPRISTGTADTTRTRIFRFRVKGVRFDAGITCHAYDMALSVVFIPRAGL